MCIMLMRMPDGISLQMQDLFFPNSCLLQELFFPDLSGQNETSSMLSLPESHWQARGWQLRLKLLSSFPSSENSQTCQASTTHCLTVRSPSHQTKIKKNIGFIVWVWLLKIVEPHLATLPLHRQILPINYVYMIEGSLCYNCVFPCPNLCDCLVYSTHWYATGDCAKKNLRPAN